MMSSANFRTVSFREGLNNAGDFNFSVETVRTWVTSPKDFNSCTEIVAVLLTITPKYWLSVNLTSEMFMAPRIYFQRLDLNNDNHDSPTKTTTKTNKRTRTTKIQSNKINTRIMTSPSIKVIPSNKLFVSEPNPMWFGNSSNPKSDPARTNVNWLKSRFHFSFAEYRNPSNSSFGTLRVMNDDLVQPKRGFGEHPHANMEIITYIVSGGLTHEDSTGTKETLGRGGIQFMTAGTGIRHSEFNHGEKPLRFIQTWINPRSTSLAPNYGSYCGSLEARKNKIHQMVSDVEDKSTSTPVEINQDTQAFASELDLGQKVDFSLPPGRQAYLLCVEGGIKVNDKQLHRHDACEIRGGGNLQIQATAVETTETGDVAHFLMFVMKEVAGSGRKDIPQ